MISSLKDNFKGSALLEPPQICFYIHPKNVMIRNNTNPFCCISNQLNNPNNLPPHHRFTIHDPIHIRLTNNFVSPTHTVSQHKWDLTASQHSNGITRLDVINPKAQMPLLSHKWLPPMSLSVNLAAKFSSIKRS
jgi:hypothetical protein